LFLLFQLRSPFLAKMGNMPFFTHLGNMRPGTTMNKMFVTVSSNAEEREIRSTQNDQNGNPIPKGVMEAYVFSDHREDDDCKLVAFGGLAFCGRAMYDHNGKEIEKGALLMLEKAEVRALRPNDIR
jgi:hypothetical protein